MFLVWTVVKARPMVMFLAWAVVRLGQGLCF